MRFLRFLYMVLFRHFASAHAVRGDKGKQLESGPNPLYLIS